MTAVLSELLAGLVDGAARLDLAGGGIGRRAVLAALEGTALAQTLRVSRWGYAAVNAALESWFNGSDRSGFGGFLDDAVGDDLSGGSGADEVHASDGLRDFRVGEDSTF